MPFEELKQRQSKMWGSGPFELLADSIADVHELVVERLALQPGERLLDIACGTGGVAERAARTGAQVTGVDFAAELVETAKRRADELGLEIEYEVGDAEDLRFDDASFDAAASSFGIMFAPDQPAAAAELARVTRPGGRIALACWTPEGAVGDMFRLTGQFQPPPPPGAGVPVQWGSEENVRRLLGDTFDLGFEQATSDLTDESGEAAWELFSRAFGPVKTLMDNLEPERGEELHRGFVEFHERYREGDEIRMPREYLLILGTRR